MTDYEKFIYMVYFHVDPTKNNKVMYVGIGKRDRPWAMSNSGGESSRYGKRSKPHFDWFVSLENLGFTLNEIVVIKHKKLSKENALRLEKDLVQELKPTFNKPFGTWALKITQNVYNDAANYHKNGLTLSQIAKIIGVSPMTIQRALAGKCINIENCWYNYVPNVSTYRLKEVHG